MSYTVIGGKLVKVQKNRRTGGNNIPALLTESIAKNKKLALKGVKDGNCNVTACQRPGATWWNTSMRAYYCRTCAHDINYWCRKDGNELICHESREVAEGIHPSAW